MVEKSDFDVLIVLRDEAMATAKSKGWYSSPEYKIGDDIAAMHAEVSELWEAHRKGELDSPCDKSEKMLSSVGESLTCAEEECADLIIKALCIASALKVDISKSVRIKNAFNKTRPFRHGKKN
ncbi:MAG TPA: hypothetical protein VM577_02600 [Anaerovoracaceae bacterium]|nr:hypothetical protein [Anaerovoracaceae bacterium]